MNRIEETVSARFRNRKDVLAVYLFGSRAGASSGARTKPDVDIGVLLARESSYPDALTAKFRISEELEKTLGMKSGEVDIVILNEAPPAFVHEVIKTGKVICDNDRERRVDFEVAAELTYYDTKPIREFFWRDLVRKAEDEP